MCNQQETQQFLRDVARQNLQRDSVMTSLGCSPLAKRAMHLQGGLPEMHPLPSCSLTITSWQSNRRVGGRLGVTGVVGGIFAVPLLNGDATCEAVAACRGKRAHCERAGGYLSGCRCLSCRVFTLALPGPQLLLSPSLPLSFVLSFGSFGWCSSGGALANSVVTNRLSGLFGCVVKAWTALALRSCTFRPGTPPSPAGRWGRPAVSVWLCWQVPHPRRGRGERLLDTLGGETRFPLAEWGRVRLLK